VLFVTMSFKDDNDGNPRLPACTAGYTPDTARTLVGPNAWNLDPWNGQQRIDDVVNFVKQYFHDCTWRPRKPPNREMFEEECT
jgi:hypothetical protein